MRGSVERSANEAVNGDYDERVKDAAKHGRKVGTHGIGKGFSFRPLSQTQKHTGDPNGRQTAW